MRGQRCIFIDNASLRWSAQKAAFVDLAVMQLFPQRLLLLVRFLGACFVLLDGDVVFLEV